MLRKRISFLWRRRCCSRAWRRVAILLIGMSATLVALGPVYDGACGSYLRAGNTGGTLLLCQLVPMLFGAPIAAVVAGVVAGLIGRGILDWILLAVGAAIGGIVGGALLGASGMGVTVLGVALIPLTIAYGIVRGVRRVRGPAGFSPRWSVALAMGFGAVAIASGVMAARLPRVWQPLVGGSGTATVRLDERGGESFVGAIRCDWSPGGGRYVGFSGERPEWPIAGVGFYLDLDDSPGREPGVRIDLAGPGPVASGTTQDVRYIAPVPVAAAVGPADLRTGRLMFVEVPPFGESEFGTGAALRPNPALPETVSGSIEWSCADAVAQRPVPSSILPLRTTNVRVVIGADGITTTPQEVQVGTIAFKGDAPLDPFDPTELWLVGPLGDEPIELLKSGDAYWRGTYGARQGSLARTGSLPPATRNLPGSPWHRAATGCSRRTG